MRVAKERLRYKAQHGPIPQIIVAKDRVFVFGHEVNNVHRLVISGKDYLAIDAVDVQVCNDTNNYSITVTEAARAPCFRGSVLNVEQYEIINHGPYRTLHFITKDFKLGMPKGLEFLL